MKIMGLEKCQQMCIEILIQWNEKGDKEIEVVISKIFFFYRNNIRSILEGKNLRVSLNFFYLSILVKLIAWKF